VRTRRRQAHQAFGFKRNPFYPRLTIRELNVSEWRGSSCSEPANCRSTWDPFQTPSKFNSYILKYLLPPKIIHIFLPCWKKRKSWAKVVVAFIICFETRLVSSFFPSRLRGKNEKCPRLMDSLPTRITFRLGRISYSRLSITLTFYMYCTGKSHNSKPIRKRGRRPPQTLDCQLLATYYYCR
jgi:hypothetical protein